MNAWFEYLRDRDPLNEMPIMSPTLLVVPDDGQHSHHPFVWVQSKEFRKWWFNNEVKTYVVVGG